LTPEIDREVEEFKNKLKIETVHASCIRKIKPKLSMEWITMITTGTTINSISSLSI
jgi:hypothetical protein